jgi:hypothetical protein
MKLEGYGRKVHDQIYGTVHTCLDGVAQTTGNLSQDSLFPGQYLNLRPPEYKAVHMMSFYCKYLENLS